MGASFLNLVTTKVTVKGEEQKFVSLRLHQRFNRHHAFTVIVNYLSPGNTFKQTPEKFINYIGETVSISFAHKQTGESYDFEGVVTQVEMVGSMGEAGGVAIHGASPTILYENNGTLDSWMDQTLSAIIKEATQEYGKVPLASNPKYSAKIPYMAQYNESVFDFMNRLSAQYGEWFYYDGKKVYFGKPDKDNTEKIMYDVDLEEVRLVANLVPGKSARYDYVAQENKQHNADTPAKPDGMNDLQSIAHDCSEKVYGAKTTAAANPHIADKAGLDGLGQVVTEIGFDGLRREYERDGAGRVTRVNRPGDKWTEYLYDGLDNILKEEQYDGEVSLYTYDKDGMLVKAENSENLLEFTRDRKTGQIIEEKQGEYTINRTYDSEGNCTRITSSLGADIRHTYDREGNLQTMQAGESWQASWVRDNTGLEVQRTFSGGVTVRTERDCFGREVHKSVRSGGIEQGAYRYQWGIANRLLSKENELTGTVTRYDYDRFDFLIRQETMQGSETDVIYRVPDFVGNLFETPDKKDRKYGAGGKLLEDPDCFYHYDDEGNLIFREFKQLQETGVKFDRKRMEKERGIRCLATGTGWLYEWSSNGMLKKVIRPDGRPVEFRYDALGRRTAKQYFGQVTRWVWDGNVPIHEWGYKVTDMQPDEEENTASKEPTEDITTWVFEAGTFVPTAKIQDGKQYSIVSDYLGTPIQMYDEQGKKTWECTLDVYGKATIFEGRSLNECPFRWAGQYIDYETNLCYNRFRYYSSETGNYLNQDPIGLVGNNPTLYAYVTDSNMWLDPFGLTAEVYKLVATKSGLYDVYEWGNDTPVDKIWLNKGDTWKIGETTDFRSRKNRPEIQNRYTQKWLKKNNLEYIPLQHSVNKSAKKAFQQFETSRIKKYEKQFGKKPAGNKCHH